MSEIIDFLNTLAYSKLAHFDNPVKKYILQKSSKVLNKVVFVQMSF